MPARRSSRGSRAIEAGLRAVGKRMAVERDLYFKKVVSLDHGRQTMQFRVSQSLFSSHQVDVGTKRLLRTLVATGSGSFHRVLDLGCGYGPIGLTLKKVGEARTVHMVDRDALALEYSRQNAELNGLSGVQIYGSLGYDDVSARDFDLVISNIPGKAGAPVISSLLQDARRHLAPGGLVAVVAIAPLESTVLEALHESNANVVFQETRSRHAVFHYEFPDGTVSIDGPNQSALERGRYTRESIVASFRGLEFPLMTAWGLPESRGPDSRSELLVEGMTAFGGAHIERAVIFNPGQGHTPVAMWRLLAPKEIVLVDRDLLSLRFSERNLVLNGCDSRRIVLSHRVGILPQDQRPADLVAGILREDEDQAGALLTLDQAAKQLAPDGVILIAASSTAVTRLVRQIRFGRSLRIKGRKRSKGRSLLVLRRD
jgi:16S rRNA (guanine1207-N2)-methyltransferase